MGLPISACQFTTVDRLLWRSLRPSAGQAQQWVREWHKNRPQSHLIFCQNLLHSNTNSWTRERKRSASWRRMDGLMDGWMECRYFTAEFRAGVYHLSFSRTVYAHQWDIKHEWTLSTLADSLIPRPDRCIDCVESRAKKSKNWEEADFYDSDEDTFLDRTGDIERKRQKRISRVKPSAQKTDNFESLVSSVLITHRLSLSCLLDTLTFIVFVVRYCLGRLLWFDLFSVSIHPSIHETFSRFQLNLLRR